MLDTLIESFHWFGHAVETSSESLGGALVQRAGWSWTTTME
jgi:hypothetical protein